MADEFGEAQISLELEFQEISQVDSIPLKAEGPSNGLCIFEFNSSSSPSFQSSSSTIFAQAAFILPNITALVSVKLDGFDYLNWTSQFSLFTCPAQS